MRVQRGDTVMFLQGDPRDVGVVEGRTGSSLSVRFPGRGNKRESVDRSQLRALADAIFEAREKGTKFRNDLSLTGGSTLAELVAAFGYATEERLRSDSLNRVTLQLVRAGLNVESESKHRDETFKLSLSQDAPAASSEEPADTVSVQQTSATQDMVNITTSVDLPEPFWPTALGLEPAAREIPFLRSLTGWEPILCLLHVPDDAELQSWLQPTWEGLVSTAFRSAQQFNRFGESDFTRTDVFIGPPVTLQTYLRPSVLSAESRQLRPLCQYR